MPRKPVNSVEVIEGNIVKKGDTKNAFRVRLIDLDGNPVNLENAIVEWTLANYEGVYFEKDAVKENQIGVVSLELTDDDVFDSGDLRIEITVIEDDSVSKYPADGWLPVIVSDTLDDLSKEPVAFATIGYFEGEVARAVQIAAGASEVAAQSQKISEESVRQNQELLAEFQEIVGDASPDPAVAQMKTGADGTVYENPQQRFLTEYASIVGRSQMFKVTQDNGYAISIPTGTDLNTFFEGGFYKSNNAVNAPTSGWYFYEIIRQGEKEALQIATNFGTKRRWIRYSNNVGVFNEWQDLTYRSDVQNMLNDQVKAYGVGVAAASGVDWNTLTKSGFYAGSTNGPTTGVVIGVHVQHGSAYAYQIAGRAGSHYYRTNENGNWSTWQKTANDADVQTIFGSGIGVTALKSITDLNGITVAGKHYFAAGATNAPNSTIGGMVEFIPNHTGNYGAQIVYGDNTRVIWYRTKRSTSWSPWLQVAGSTADAKWEDLTPRGGSAIYDTANPPQVLRIGDIVMLRGALKGITGRSFLALTLPGHARPQKDTAALANISIGTNFIARNARWNIGTNGDMTMLYTSDNSFDAIWWSLDGIWFPVTSS